MCKFKQLLANYKAPTPTKWRKLGDALLAVSTFLATFTLVEGYSKWIALGTLVTGVLGKFITNFFAVEQNGTEQ